MPGTSNLLKINPDIIRGEGLFPANFVSLDLDAADTGERRKSVQFNEEVVLANILLIRNRGLRIIF